MADAHVGCLGAVAEVPGPGGDRAIGIARSGAVEQHVLIDPDQEVLAGVRDRLGVGDHVVLHGRGIAFAGGRVGLDCEPHDEGAGLLVDVIDARALGGSAVAEVPAPALNLAGRARGLAGIEARHRADCDRARARNLGDRRLDHLDVHLVGVGVVALARLVALDRQ
jgi:hypothetical protein